jgi:glycine cleavage system H protein
MSETRTGARLAVQGYEVAVDRAYDPETHLWIQVQDGERVRVGMDPLAVETSGTLAQLAFEPLGSTLRRGDPFGSLEAAKFVGPLITPLSGVVARHNDLALADPGIVERDPLGDGWLVELEPSDLDAEVSELLAGEQEIVHWFEAKLEEYRVQGVLAE